MSRALNTLMDENELDKLLQTFASHGTVESGWVEQRWLDSDGAKVLWGGGNKSSRRTGLVESLMGRVKKREEPEFWVIAWALKAGEVSS